MPKINLLPEDLRRREEKEMARVARTPKVVSMEFSSGGRENLSQLKSDKPKKSFWAKIFGSAKPLAKPLPRPWPAPSVAPSRELSVSAQSPKENLSFKTARVPRRSGGGFSWLAALGAPRSPVRMAGASPEADKVIEQRVKIKPLMPKAAAAPGSKTKSSFWRWFFGQAPRKKMAAPAGFPGGQAAGSASRPPLPPLKPLPPQKETAAPKEEASRFHQAPKIGPGGLGVNLMPQELVKVSYYGYSRQLISAVLVIAISGSLVIGAYFALNAYKRSLDGEKTAKNGQIEKLNKELIPLRNEYNKQLFLEKKVLALSKILAGHIYWTNFLKLLEKYTLDGVYYKDFSVDVSGAFTLPAVARDYQALAQQVAVFKDASDFIKEVKVGDVRLNYAPKGGIDGVAFELKLVLADKILRPAEK